MKTNRFAILGELDLAPSEDNSRVVTRFEPADKPSAPTPRYGVQTSIVRMEDVFPLSFRKRKKGNENKTKIPNPDLGSKNRHGKVRPVRPRELRIARETLLRIKRRLCESPRNRRVLVAHTFYAEFFDASLIPYVKVHSSGWLCVVKTPSKRAASKLVDLAIHSRSSLYTGKSIRYLCGRIT